MHEIRCHDFHVIYDIFHLVNLDDDRQADRKNWRGIELPFFVQAAVSTHLTSSWLTLTLTSSSMGLLVLTFVLTGIWLLSKSFKIWNETELCGLKAPKKGEK
jgi:hypothetical protein